MLLEDVGCWKERLRRLLAPWCVCAAALGAAALKQELLCKQDNKWDPETALH